MEVSHVLQSALLPSAGVRRGRHRWLGPWCPRGDQAQAGVLRALSCHLTFRNRWESQQEQKLSAEALWKVLSLSVWHRTQFCSWDAMRLSSGRCWKLSHSISFSRKWQSCFQKNSIRRNKQQECWYVCGWMGRSWEGKYPPPDNHRCISHCCRQQTYLLPRVSTP